MAYPWIKLYTEIIHDPKIGRLPEHLQLVFVKLLCATGEYDQAREGILPPIDELAWTLRMDDECMAADMAALERAGLVLCADGIWRVTNFGKRQGPMSATERKQAQRERDHRAEYYCHDNVTIRDTEGEGEGEGDIEEEEEGEGDVEGEGGVTEPSAATIRDLSSGLQELGIMPYSRADAELIATLAEDIDATPTPALFVRSLLLEVGDARRKSERGHPPGLRFVRAVVDGAIRENRLPGERAPAAGPPKPALRLVTETWRNPYTGETETHRVAMPVDEVSHGNG